LGKNALKVNTLTGGTYSGRNTVAQFVQTNSPLTTTTAFVMVFHFLEFMAGLAVKIAVTLLAFSVLAVVFGPTRALGGALLFFALIMIVPSYIGYYLAPLGMEFSRKTPTQPNHSTKKLKNEQKR
jgi:hypothetical protein